MAARLELDAVAAAAGDRAGALHVAERVVEVEGSGRLRTGAGRDERFDLIVGADGAGSLVRRTFLAPTPPARLAMAVGWFARGTSPMLVRFTPGLDGYLWLFPRPDHVGVGICAPLARGPDAPAARPGSRPRWRGTSRLSPTHDAGATRTRSLRPPPTRRSILEIAGPRWALVGDAAALADPITGEGIYYALRSAERAGRHAAGGRLGRRAIPSARSTTSAASC